MKITTKLLALVLFINTVFTNAQNETNLYDSVQQIDTATKKTKKTLLQKNIVPLSLIGIGLALNNSNFEKDFQKNIRKNVGENYKTSIDDYLVFVPVVQLYAADIFGVKAKNHWFDQSKYLFISNVVSTGISQLLKSAILKTRPDGLPESFPSGHSTIAFTNAAVLMNEFKETSPILAYSGYTFATTTGIFRMANNKHYIADVLVGAGIGILVTQLVYHFEPLKNFNPFIKSKKSTFIPQFTENTVGFYFKYEL